MELNAAILRIYAITEETYRPKFRTIRKSGNETYVELMVWLRDLANKWMWDCKSVEAVIEELAWSSSWMEFHHSFMSGCCRDC